MALHLKGISTLFLCIKNPFNFSFHDFWHDGMCFEIITVNAKGGKMQQLKEMIAQLVTGFKNRFSPDGTSAGKYQMAVIFHSK